MAANSTSYRWRRGIVFAGLTVSVAFASEVNAQWPQWGGPDRDFTVEATGLAGKWPENGPNVYWRRELGEGYSSVVYDNGLLYTMYRKDVAAQEEYTIALDANTGETIWEHSSPSPVPQREEDWGFGPNSTPLVAGSRLYSIGSGAMLHCFDKRGGKVLWKHDLAAEFGAPFPGEFGYSSSPIAYKNLIITPVGRRHPDDPGGAQGAGSNEVPDEAKSQALVAFDQMSGSVVWKNHDFRIDHSSPILINFDGEDQLVAVTRQSLVGVSPESGKLLWRYAFPQGQTQHVMTPIAVGADRIFCSCGNADIGSRLIKLTKKDGKTVPEELWHSRKMRFIQSNPVRIGDHLYGSSGGNPAIIMGVDLTNGKRKWVQRGFEQAAFVHADGKIIFVDWNGRLVLATATPDGLVTHSECQLMERYSFTAPTLVGKTLYLRDRKHIMALDMRGTAAGDTG